MRRRVAVRLDVIEAGGHRGEKIVEEARQPGIVGAGGAAQHDEFGGDERGRGLSVVIDAAGHRGRRFRFGLRVDITLALGTGG